MAGRADETRVEADLLNERGWDALAPGGASGAAPHFTILHDLEDGSPPGDLATRSWTIPIAADPWRDDPALDFSLSPPPARGESPTINQSVLSRASGLGPRAATAEGPQFPAIGSKFAGFRLVSELGRGAFARVYLAEQEALSNRLVALKVSPATGDEYRVLARLQHAHIVPIHSVHHDPDTGLRLLCMPYLGGANLAQVLQAAGAGTPTQATGGSLVEALDEVGARIGLSSGPLPDLSNPSPSRRALMSGLAGEPGIDERLARPDRCPSSARSLWRKHWARGAGWERFEDRPALRASSAGEGGPGDGEDPGQPARHFLRRATHIQAAVWIVARLAEGLDHAHSRGLIHRDLKPSNVLIAADGTPMLLDFNLAADAGGGEEGARAMFGGTLPYMAPEHLDAFNPRGSTPAEAVDERSDIYALGLILFEMVAGRAGFPDPPSGMPTLESLAFLTEGRLKGAPSLRAANPMAPWSLDAILRKCLDPDPARRYARANDLAEDLRCFLDDLPLKHVREPSLRERLGKWARRNPRAMSSTSIATVALVLILACSAASWATLGHLESASARLKLSAFGETFRRCQLLLNTGGPSGHLEGGIALARRALDDYGVNRPGDWLAGPSARGLSPDQKVSLREDIAELALLLARAEVTLSARGASEADRRGALTRAIAWLDRAERIDPRPSAAIFEERARFENALGLADLAARDRKSAEQTAPTTSRDFYLAGTALLARGEADRAERALAKAVDLDARRFWAWFALGLCHLEQGRHAEAAGDFGVCAALAPDFAWPHLNRGLALARAGRLEEARRSYDRALHASANFVEALVDRGLVLLELGDSAGAVADFDRAVDLGRRDPAILAARAEALSRLGRRDEAARAFDEALAVRPRDPILLVARGFFRLSGEPARSESDFRRALEIDPHNARAHLGLAFRHKADDPRVALAEAEAALAADANLGDALQLRAILRARMGDAAALGDVDRLLLLPTPARIYNAACTVAILSETTADPRLLPRALALLKRALAVGMPASRAAEDPDLKPLRALPEYRELIRTPQAASESGDASRAATATARASGRARSSA